MSHEEPDLSLAYVVPRYGVEIIGGAENATRMLAEALVRLGRAKVEVLTTTALSIDTWANHFPVGTENINGVVVRRFAVDSGRLPGFAGATKRALAAPAAQSLEEAAELIRMQGPVSGGLLQAIAASRHDAVLFYPYLYHPTVEGTRAARVPVIMHPAAHDEPVIDLPIFEQVFARVSGFAYQTAAERKIVESRFQVAHKPSINLGMGFEPYSGPSGGFLAEIRMKNRPFVLCLGRVDAPKGTTLLVDLFREYKERNPSDLQLVLAGPISISPNPAPDVHLLGPVSDAAKEELLAECSALISPSAFESFAIVLLEAWSHRKPVLVNALCAATTEQVQRSGGGLSFDGFETFEAALSILATEADTAAALGQAGWRYAMNRYHWPDLIERYVGFLRHVITAEARRGLS
ncbi:MAG: glycosyltransferase family 4 protein [Actinomycetota bacterium]|nr:glycosyltransferase family 4 protein [Actinomycetota bacterium]